MFYLLIPQVLLLREPRSSLWCQDGGHELLDSGLSGKKCGDRMSGTSKNNWQTRFALGCVIDFVQ